MNNQVNQRQVKASTFMNQTIYVTPYGGPQVSLECSRGSLDLSPAEALEVAAALTWAANAYGGHQGRPGT